METGRGKCGVLRAVGKMCELIDRLRFRAEKQRRILPPGCRREGWREGGQGRGECGRVGGVGGGRWNG